MTSKMYYKDMKQRMEINTERGQAINIVRLDKKLVWMLMPKQHMYMEMPLNMQKQGISSQLHDPQSKVTKEFLGNDTVDGHPAKKYHVTVITNGRKESGYMWEATDLNNFPVKYQSEDKKTTVIWKNIKFGGIPDSLFEVPAGYKKMEMPMMPGMGGPGMPRR